MNIVRTVQDYIDKMVLKTDTGDLTGMKALLLDKETTGIVSLVHSQSNILSKEVYLVERMEPGRKRERLFYLKAVVFVRPTKENVELLCQELRNPNFSEYHIYFSHAIQQSYIEKLANADEFEVVKNFQEVFADYLADSPQLFHLGMPSIAREEEKLSDEARKEIICRIKQGVTSVLLSLKLRPVVRYSSKSIAAQTIATAIQRLMDEEQQLFSFRQRDREQQPLLLIIDRMDDPVTPLLNQWTYQAMVHELLGIVNNRVDLSGVPNIRPDQQEVILASHQDSFYADNMYTNFGDFAVKIQDLLLEFQAKSRTNENIDSIADMQRFVASYPEFRKASATTSKHVAISSELSRQVGEKMLMEVSEMEQNLVAGETTATEAASIIKKLLTEDRVQPIDKLRLVLLYRLRFEPDASAQLKASELDTEMLASLPAEQRQDKQVLIKKLLQFGGAERRTTDLFQKGGLLKEIKKMKRSIKECNNVYTQHIPQLRVVLDQIAKSRLSDKQYPFVEPAAMDKKTLGSYRPQEVIVFIAGGVTYEEAASVSQFNASNPTMQVVLGGNTILRTQSFLDELEKL